MGYNVVDPEAVAPAPDRPCTERPISDAAGLQNLGCHHYAADPGEQVPLAYNPEDTDERVGTLVVGAPAVDDVHPYEP